MESWLQRRLKALDERLDPGALEISARHAKVRFEEPPTGDEVSRWCAPAIALELWLPAVEEGMVRPASELDWAIDQGLIDDPGADVVLF